MTVYLIHFEYRYHHAGHYLGFTDDLETRIETHRASEGARLLEVINAAGINWWVVRLWWHGDRTFERKLKNQHNGPRLCPICNPAVAVDRDEWQVIHGLNEDNEMLEDAQIEIVEGNSLVYQDFLSHMFMDPF